MGEARTAAIKYVFLDVVNYSQDRSVEAQTDIIGTLNQLVRTSTQELALPDDRVIFLPTGDGICIALVAVESPFDIHLRLALKLLEHLDSSNSTIADEMRKFAIRIGINQNVDNLVTDINGKPNVAGAGVNVAQRVMSAGDANQILVGQAVFETLRHREKYMKSFRSYTATAKHDVALPVHQFIESHKGLDISTPSQFRVAEKEEKNLTKFAAYYMAHAIKNRESLLRVVNALAGGGYAAIVLLNQIARDSVGFSEASETSPYRPHTWKAGVANFRDQFDFYYAIDFWVTNELAFDIVEQDLPAGPRYFDESSGCILRAHFVTADGREKLRNDWPTIWKEFGFDKEWPRLSLSQPLAFLRSRGNGKPPAGADPGSWGSAISRRDMWALTA
jgi:class 3 adenylate cyclase